MLIADSVGKDWYDRSDEHNIREWVWCVKHLRQGMTVADCGAHHGCLSVVFAKAVGPKGRVRAFEALPRNAEIVERNFQINDCANGSVRAVALSERRGPIKLAAGDAGQTVYSGASRDQTIELVGSTLDAELPAGADFLKIDVEGSEVEMLRGAGRALRRRPIIDLEIHNHLFPDRRSALEEIFGALSSFDYCYSWLPLAFEGEIRPMGWRVDISEIAQFDNPHLFCLPVAPRPRDSLLRRGLNMFSS
jgi:FkbM family methyltransferase